MARSKEKMPKTAQRTTIAWKWNIYHANTDTRGGWHTNLPANPLYLIKGASYVPRLNAVTVASLLTGDGGEILLEFDQPIQGNEPGDELVRLCRRAYNERIIDNLDGPDIRVDKAYLSFELARREGSFCDGAIDRVTWLLAMLGLTSDRVGAPTVTQETFVWEPGHRNPCDNDPDWMPFGQFLARKHNLIT